MRHAFQVIARHVRIGVINELQYRVNFWIQLFQTALSCATALGGLVVVFGHTETLGGWRPRELVALLGVYFLIRGAIYSLVQPSLQLFMEDVRRGTLDFVLLKPVDAQLLVSVRRFGVWHATDAVMGLVLLVGALVSMDRTVSPDRALAFVFALGCGLVIVYSFWMLLATCSFWFVRVENILVIFESMYQAGKWPVDLYPPVFRAVLTFVVPVSFAVTVPAETLTGRVDPSMIAGTFGVAVLLLGASRAFWRWGIRSYSGASA